MLHRREPTVKYTWRVSRRDGHDQPRSFRVSETDDRWLEESWRQIEREHDPVVKAALARSLRTVLDLFALFEGEFVAPEEVVPPAYQRIDAIPAEAA